MNTKQSFVTLLIIIILVYTGLYGLVYNLVSSNELHHYVLFILNIIPSVSILIGLATRLFMGRTSTTKKYFISFLACTLSSVLFTILYTTIYKTTKMLSDFSGFIIYCLVLNIILIICNIVISIMGVNNRQA